MFDVCEIDREPKLAIGLSVRAAVHGQQREFAAIAKTASRRGNAGENRQVELIRNGLRRAHPGVECLSQERDAETNDQADDGPKGSVQCDVWSDLVGGGGGLHDARRFRLHQLELDQFLVGP